MSSRYINARRTLSNSYQRFTRERKGRVGFLGGSITEMEGWRSMISEVLQKRFPETDFEFINAGISSTDSTLGAHRISLDVFSHGKTDLLFVEFAVNELHNSRRPEESRRGMEGILRQALRHNPNIDIILNYSADDVKNVVYQEGKTPPEIEAFEQIAGYYGVTSLNFAQEVSERLAAGEFDWETFGGVHPAPYGHRIYADTIGELFDQAWMQAAEQEAGYAPHPFPEKEYEPGCYQYGHFVDIQEAELVEGFQVDPCWHPLEGRTRKQYVDIPMLEAVEIGSELKLDFTGTSVGILATAGPDAGRILCSIDGGEEFSLDLFTHWSKGLHIPWVFLIAAGLSQGGHQLRMTIAEDKNDKSRGHAVRIAAFLVNGMQS